MLWLPAIPRLRHMCLCAGNHNIGLAHRAAHMGLPMDYPVVQKQVSVTPEVVGIASSLL